MKTSDFDYELPGELIAQQAVERGRSRLLTLSGDGSIGSGRRPIGGGLWLVDDNVVAVPACVLNLVGRENAIPVAG